MKYYLVGIISDKIDVYIVANSDSLKPYIIKYCGEQTGNNYSTIWGAARKLEKIRDSLKKNGFNIMEITSTPDLVPVVGCQPDWIKKYFKRGYYSII